VVIEVHMNCFNMNHFLFAWLKHITGPQAERGQRWKPRQTINGRLGLILYHPSLALPPWSWSKTKGKNLWHDLSHPKCKIKCFKKEVSHGSSLKQIPLNIYST
jgi:hypothetical protein